MKGVKIVTITLLVALVATVPVAAKAKLVFGFKGQQGELDLTTEIVNAFNASHPDVEVEILDMTVGGTANWVEKLSVLYAAGTAPDVIRAEYQRSYPYVVDKLMLPLDDFIKKDASFNIKDFFPIAVTAHSEGGKIYGIPQEAQPMTLFINKTRFDNAGIGMPSPDWTVDDLVTIARKLTVDTNQDGKTDMYGLQMDASVTRLDPWLMAFGARMLTEDRSKAAVDSPAALRALEFIGSLGTTYNVRGGNWAQGTAAIYSMGGPWNVPDYRRAITGWDWDILPMPGGPGGRGTTLVCDGYHIASTTRYPEAAWEFVKYITSVESLTLLAKGGSIIPGRSNLAVPMIQRQATAAPYNMQAYLKGIDIARPTQLFKGLGVSDKPVSDVINGLWSGKLSLTQAGADLAKALNALI